VRECFFSLTGEEGGHGQTEALPGVGVLYACKGAGVLSLSDWQRGWCGCTLWRKREGERETNRERKREREREREKEGG
jgi:hypothetical protein